MRNYMKKHILSDLDGSLDKLEHLSSFHIIRLILHTLLYLVQKTSDDD